MGNGQQQDKPKITVQQLTDMALIAAASTEEGPQGDNEAVRHALISIAASLARIAMAMEGRGSAQRGPGLYLPRQ